MKGARTSTRAKGVRRAARPAGGSVRGGANLEPLRLLVFAQRKIGRLLLEPVVESARASRVARRRTAPGGVRECPMAQRILLELRSSFVTFGRVGPATRGLEALCETLHHDAVHSAVRGRLLHRLLEQRDRLVAAACCTQKLRLLDRRERGRDRALVLRRKLRIALLVLLADRGSGGGIGELGDVDRSGLRAHRGEVVGADLGERTRGVLLGVLARR